MRAILLATTSFALSTGTAYAQVGSTGRGMTSVRGRDEFEGLVIYALVAFAVILGIYGLIEDWFGRQKAARTRASRQQRARTSKRDSQGRFVSNNILDNSGSTDDYSPHPPE
jgi:hypothetical protein